MNDLPALDPLLCLRGWHVQREPTHTWEGHPLVTEHQMMKFYPDPPLFLALLQLRGVPLDPWVLEDEIGDPRDLDERGAKLLRYQGRQFRDVLLEGIDRDNRAVITYFCAVPPDRWVILDWF